MLPIPEPSRAKAQLIAAHMSAEGATHKAFWLPQPTRGTDVRREYGGAEEKVPGSATVGTGEPEASGLEGPASFRARLSYRSPRIDRAERSAPSAPAQGGAFGSRSKLLEREERVCDLAFRGNVLGRVPEGNSEDPLLGALAERAASFLPPNPLPGENLLFWKLNEHDRAPCGAPRD